MNYDYILVQTDFVRNMKPWTTDFVGGFLKILKIIIEHVSTKEMVQLIKKYGNLFATVTLQHMIFTVEDVFNLDGSIKYPEGFCLPVVKELEDQEAILREILNGNPKFFFAPDFAPHPWENKILPQPKGGVAALPLEMISEVVDVFYKNKMLDKLPNFISNIGRKVYGLEPDKKTITLRRKPWIIPRHDVIANFKHGQTTNWTVI